MIRRWLQKVFIEAWESYESKFIQSVNAVRDPNKGDAQDKRAGCIWYNEFSKTEFTLQKIWVKDPIIGEKKT